MLEKRPDNNRLPSVTRAATSPTAIVLAGAGVAIGLAAGLSAPFVVLLGAAGYGARVGWAALRRRSALRKRAERRLARIDPWSVPEPWRGYTARALDARKRYHQLASDCPPGTVADYLAGAIAKVDGAVEEEWALARSGASMAGPAGRADQLAQELDRVHVAMSRAVGADRVPLESREAALASELRSLRQSEVRRRSALGSVGRTERSAGGRGGVGGPARSHRRGGRRRPVVAVLRAGVAVQGARRSERHHGGRPSRRESRQLEIRAGARRRRRRP